MSQSHRPHLDVEQGVDWLVVGQTACPTAAVRHTLHCLLLVQVVAALLLLRQRLLLLLHPGLVLGSVAPQDAVGPSRAALRVIGVVAHLDDEYMCNKQSIYQEMAMAGQSSEDTNQQHWH